MSEQTSGQAVGGDNPEDIVAKADTGARNPSGLPAKILFLVALAWSLFQIWIASPFPFWFRFGIFNDTQARSIHLAFALFLAFTAYPGIVKRTGGVPVFAIVFGLAGAGFLLYAASLFAGGSEQWPIFAIMALVAGAVAFAAFRPKPLDVVPAVDWVLAVLAAVSAGYLYIFYTDLAARPGLPTLLDLIAAGVGMVLLLEATRRALGPALLVIACIFLFYTFGGQIMPDMIAHRGSSFQRAMSQQWLTAEGVFGIALGVSTSFVFLFVLFGALLDKAGAGNYFIKVAFSLLGHFRGGPAKAAVVASGLTGLISGSSIANVVTTGTFTIPLMKRVGFPAERAGAVEVAASTNGQIMPPVMGAAAFLMVEYVGIPYVDVIRHAFLPAIISYIGLLYLVHLEAVKDDLKGLPRRTQTVWYRSAINFGITVASLIILAGAIYYGIGWTRDVFGPIATNIVAIGVLLAYLALLWVAAREDDLELDDPNAPVIELPEVGKTLRTGLHFILPVVVLVWALIVERLSPGLSAFYAVAFLIFILLTQRPIIALMRRASDIVGPARQGVIDLFQGLVAGARNMVGIGVATAAAGIIVGVVAQTGIGGVLVDVVQYVSGGNLLIMLILTAAICILLGLGLPTTANYIIVATLMAPVLVELGSQQGLVIPLIAAHLFVFYFGLMADVTPPVGLASFAAAAVSRGDPIRTGLKAISYDIRTMLLPFIFIFNTQLLLIGIGSPFELILLVVSSIGAMLLFAAGTQGFFIVRSRIYESVLLLIVCFTLFRPGFWMDMIYPPYESRSPAEVVEIAEQLPENGYIRLSVEGLSPLGDNVSKTVMLNLGPEGSGQERLAQAGLQVMTMGEQAQITSVDFGSEAERFGVNFGMQITEVLVVDESRPPKELMFIPALLILGLVYWLQRRRRNGGKLAATDTAKA
ncbi:TRAP transporter permease [Pelagibacterium flavum]|uniref:TRAP transporter permease n=1 Tax=Pelagibacterium flavum TaxID=2984530 RepID=A0ABY6IR92_9HYPH|nr:TRAP transporter permease [Pelagibacterium sp. YIM 151497]UYQ73142.1 TRAP transporter permease [Pelagibacterium sp. YIM 151497]